MKNYETPKMEILKLEATDIIQTSDPQAAQPKLLKTKGFSIGNTTGTNIFK